jgi:hypothetical protein
MAEYKSQKEQLPENYKHAIPQNIPMNRLESLDPGSIVDYHCYFEQEESDFQVSVACVYPLLLGRLKPISSRICS